MGLFFMITLLLIAGLLNPILSQSTCPSCDCVVRRPPVVDQLITAKISRVLNDQPIVRMLRIFSDNARNVYLRRVNTTTLLVGQSEALAQFTLTDPTMPIDSGPFAYRPMFSGNHNSRLGTLFINIDEVFPCVAGTDYNAICRVFTEEDDGFRGGRAVLDSGDDGNTFRIFGGTSTETYGFAFQNCPYLNTTCLPAYHSFTIVCHLPASCDPYM